MGINGMMRTSVSGMGAQGSRLSAISDNIAHSSTTGYKTAETLFSSFVMGSGRNNDYQSGSVKTHTRYNITTQGIQRETGRPSNIMIQGNGFFRVVDDMGVEFLTRDGSFERTAEGYLKNSVGFYLIDEDGNRVSVKGNQNNILPPEPTTNVKFGVILKADEKIIPADSSDPISRNGEADYFHGFRPNEPKTYNQKVSIAVYNDQGIKSTIDAFYVKRENNSWEIFFCHTGEDGKCNPVEGHCRKTISFNKDGTYNDEWSGNAGFAIEGLPGFSKPIEFDLGDKGANINQVGNEYSNTISVNGMPPGSLQDITYSESGEILLKYSNGKTVIKGHVGMISVAAPDMLDVVTGNVFKQNQETGMAILGRPNSGYFGKLVPGMLEESMTDVGKELTEMIEAQRNYTANSKVFQTGSELMDVIVNLKR